MGPWNLRPAMVIAFYGTSLTTGRLSTFWVEYLIAMLRSVPECVGPLFIQNMGKGSQTSDWGRDNAYTIANLDPTHIWSEGFAINDSALVSGSPQVSRANHLVNMQAMHDTWKAQNPEVIITWQTMNPVSTVGESLRPDLALYYGDEVSKAAAMGDRMLNNYNGPLIPPGQTGGWQKPLALGLTDNNDGLHPIRQATDVYLLPNVIFDVRKAMATYWGLAAPVAAASLPPLEIFYEAVAGGGGGGGLLTGGGGGGGEPKTGSLLSIDPSLPIGVGAGGLAGQTAGAPGENGGNSTIGVDRVVAYGGGGGGRGNNPSNRNGTDGASGGGGGGTAASTGGRAYAATTGNNGGLGTNSSGGGGGGGKGGVGANGVGVGGQGGVGVASTVPGQTGVTIAAGGPGGPIYPFSRPAYLAGAGPTSIGGGGGGGGPTGGVAAPGDNGGAGRVTLWYAGAQQGVGGVVTASGGYTIHTFDTPGTALFTRYP